MTETTIAFTELLGRRVRMGPWEDQKVSTYRKIMDALDGARWDEAAQLASYFVEEAHGACELPMITAELPGAG